MAFMGQERNPLVSRTFGKTQAGPQQALTSPLSAHLWLQQKQPQLGHPLSRTACAKDRPHATLLGPANPASLATGIMRVDGVLRVSAHQGTERVIEPVRRVVERRMTIHQPIQVCGRKRFGLKPGHPAPQRASQGQNLRPAPLGARGWPIKRTDPMAINDPNDTVTNLQIGPTDTGMVRLYLQNDKVDLPLDFDPDEADEIAEELRAAAQRARQVKKRP